MWHLQLLKIKLQKKLQFQNEEFSYFKIAPRTVK